jgi:hypothetical protein
VQQSVAGPAFADPANSRPRDTITPANSLANIINLQRLAFDREWATVHVHKERREGAHNARRTCGSDG